MPCLVSMDKLIIRPVYKAQFMKKQRGVGGGRLYDYYYTITIFGVFFSTYSIIV